jgi:hemolysin-activating ACP:hemolysin acyltransferase
MGTIRKLTSDFDANGRAMPAGALGAMSPGRSNAFASSFAQIVAVLMRDPTFKQMTLANLEALVLPPLIAGQFAIAHAQAQGAGAKKAGAEGSVVVPVAVALWARVSPDIDKTLSENPEKPPRLQPSGWVSGSTIWLMVLGGDRRAIPKLLDQLLEKDFSGQVVKMRVGTPDGKVAVKTLSAKDERSAMAPPASAGKRSKHAERAVAC